MELGDYLRLMRRWWAFLLLCTMLAVVVGKYLADRGHHALRFDGTATVLVNYVTPYGAPYNPTISKQDITVALSDRVKDPGVEQVVRDRLNLNRQTALTVSSTVAQDAPLITIHATGISATSAETFATGMAEELAALHSQQIKTQSDEMRRQRRAKLSAARHKFLTMQRRYYHVCGCVGSPARPSVSQTALQNLQANLSLQQQEWQTALSDYNNLGTAPIAPATALPGTAKPLTTGSSTTKTVGSAAILGFLLALGLAALIDYLRDLPFFVRKRTLQAQGPVVVSIEFKVRQNRHAVDQARAQPSGRLSAVSDDANDDRPRLAGGDQH